MSSPRIGLHVLAGARQIVLGTHVDACGTVPQPEVLHYLASLRCVRSAISSTPSNCGGFIGLSWLSGTVRISPEAATTTSAVLADRHPSRTGT